MKKCAIFAAAPIGNFDYINIEPDTMVICADAGIRHAKALGKIPDLVLGDFDSCDKNETEGFCTVSFPPRKDDTDLMLAVKYGMEAGCEDFTIFGALGGKRLDHTVASFAVLGYLADNGLSGKLVDENTTVRILEVGEHIIANNGGYLSLFPFGCDRVSVLLSGTSYEGHVLLTSSFPLGVSNEIIGHSAVVTVLQGDEMSRALLILSQKDY